jgi:hypothetical protein
MRIDDLAATTTSSGIRFWRYAFLLLLLLEIASLWSVRYLPTQDGPSHLHNAAALAHHGASSYSAYYTIDLLQPAGNLLTQLLLAGLLQVLDPLTAEKVLVSGYVVLFFLSFRYLLQALTPYADYFCFFAGIPVLNFFFYKGFWNFLYSVCLALFLLGYYVRQRGLWTPRSLGLFLAGGIVLYMTHVVSWVVCLVAVAVLGIPLLINGSRRAVVQYLLPIFVLLPPALLLLLHLGRSSREEPVVADPISIRMRIYSLYNPDFLHTFVETDLLLTKLVLAALFIVFLFVVWILLRRPFSWDRIPIALLPLACGAIVMVGPDQQGTGSYIHARVVLYVWLFFVAWLAAARPWPPMALHGVAAVLFSLGMFAFVTRLPMLSEWNTNLSAVDVIGQHIRPGATVLQLNLERDTAIDPYRHAVDLLSEKAIIDLRNYEASTGTFPIYFRPGMSPFPLLGTAQQLEAIPPVFDIDRYEKQTRGRVDYLLFFGRPGAETQLYPGRLSQYTLLSSAGRFRLYQRR